MFGITAISGNDVLIINGHVFTGFADADAIKFEPQGPIAQMKVSKDGNSVYAMQFSGIVGKLTIRLIRGAFDDIFLNGLLQQWIADPSLFILMSGSYVKRIGDGKGGLLNEVYQLAGGVFEAIPPGTTNTDGNIEQSVVVYTFMFRNDARLMQ